MRTYYIFSDVHSYYDFLMDALNEKGFDINNPDHYIISLGDACDRGPDADKVLLFLIHMNSRGRAILIRGNHEDLMEKAIARRYFESHDFHNCTHETVEKLTQMNINDYSDTEMLEAMSKNELWNTYINATRNYCEIGDNIFVHGWIPTTFKVIEDERYKDLPIALKPIEETYNPDWRNATDFEWDDARWLNGMKAWKFGYGEPDKTIWCGHYHTSWGHSRLHNDGKEWLDLYETYYIDPDTGKQEPHCNHGPFEDEGIIAMDACTAISNIVNVKTLEVE